MVLPDGFIQFNDKPEGGGVSATQKNSELKHSSATFAIHRPIRPKGLAADGDGASSWCGGRVRVRQAGGLFILISICCRKSSKLRTTALGTRKRKLCYGFQ